MRRRPVLTGWKLHVVAGVLFYAILSVFLWEKWIVRHSNKSVLDGLPEVAVFTAVATICFLACLAFNQRRRGR
jgi:TRAP-type C4-dicarboxylate transport system permease small subunit